MQGDVHTINRRRGLVAIATDAGFTIAEVLSGEPIHLGDLLEWKTIELGNAVLENLSNGTRHHVNVDVHRAAGATGSFCSQP